MKKLSLFLLLLLGALGVHGQTACSPAASPAPASENVDAWCSTHTNATQSKQPGMGGSTGDYIHGAVPADSI
jgi:hypothetical protein